MELKLINTSKTNIEEVTLLEGYGDINVRFVYNLHGKMIPTEGGPNNKKTYSKRNCHIKFTEESYDTLGSRWTSCKLYINGELIEGEWSQYSGSQYDDTGKLEIRATVMNGWG